MTPEQIVFEVARARAEFELCRMGLREEERGLSIDSLTYSYIVDSRKLVARIRAAIAAEVAAELAKAAAA
jgi:hypothetical protein